MPLIQRRGEDWPEESFIQISEAQVGRAVRTARWKYGVDAPFKQGWQDSEEEGWLEPAGSASMKYEEQYLCALATLLSCPPFFRGCCWMSCQWVSMCCADDLQTDPYELRNLVGYPSHAHVADVMRERLLRRMVEAGEPEPTIVPATPPGAAGRGQTRIRDDEALM